MKRRGKLLWILGLLMITCVLAGCSSDDSKTKWDELDDGNLYNTSIPVADNTAEGEAQEQAEAAPLYETAALKSLVRNGLEYNLYSNGELAIRGGDLTVRLANEDSLKNDLSSIKTISFGDGVTSVAEDACQGMTNVTTVRLGSSVRKIEKNAFGGCSSLQTVYWGGVEEIGPYAFSGCESLTQLSFPATIKKIGDNAFNNCSRLQSVVISNPEIAMGNDIFMGCGNFTNLTMEGNVPDSAFSGCAGLKTVIIGDSAVSIGKNAFNKCTALENVRFQGNRVIAIGDSAFSGCSALKNIELPESLLSIGRYAFSGCGEMLEAAIPGRVVLIDDNAFENCGKLSSVSFADAEKQLEMGRYAFAGCGLTSIRLDGCIKAVGDHAFDGCSKLTDAAIGKDVSINNNSSIFANCAELRNLSVDLPQIPISAFKEINNLNALTLGEHVTVIGDSAFADCKSMQSLLIPSTVEKVGRSAFQNCQALSTVEVYAKEIASNSFEGCGGITTLTLDMPAVPDSAFIGLTNIKTVRFGSRVTEIGISSFENCTALNMPELGRISMIRDYAFRGCTGISGFLNISGQSLALGENVFGGCTGITGLEIHIPSIPSNAFKGLSGLTSLTLGEEVRSIGDYAFDGCGLTRLTLPASIESLGSGTFQNCASLHSVEIHTDKISASTFRGCAEIEEISIDIASIPDSAFKGMQKLKTARLGDRVKTIGASAFEDCTALGLPDLKYVTAIGDNAFRNCTGMHGLLMIGSETTSIGSNAFGGCTEITGLEIHIPSIPSNAFKSLSGLTSLTLGEEVRSICDYAFDGCGLTKLTLPATLESLGNGTFQNCASLHSVEIHTDHVSASTFRGCAEIEEISIDIAVIPDSAFKGMQKLKTARLGDQVKTIGASAFEDCTALRLPDLKHVTAIGDNAFRNCTGMHGLLTIGSETASIGSNAFGGCTEITGLEIHIPNIPANAFKGLSGLTSLTLGEEVRSIGDYAFDGCGLTRLTLPASIESLGDGTFQNCASLHSVEIHTDKISASTFRGCAEIEEISIDVASIPDSAFKGMQKLKTARLGDRVKTIGASAFEDCTALGLPDLKYVTAIGDNAFRNCTGMHGLLTIGNKIKSIGSSAFGGCTGITGLEIHALAIPDAAFKGMSGVSSLTLGKEVKIIGAYAFDGCSLNAVNIPDTVDQVGVSAFQNNALLKEAVIGRNVNLAEDVFKDCGLTKLTIDTDVPDRAFRNLTGLVEVTLKERVKRIGEYAFEGTGLTSLTLPGTVENVGKYAFSKCASLSSLEILARAFDSTSFSECEGLITLTINTATIPRFAFRNRADINSLTLKDGVKAVGESAFEGCTGLTKLSLNQVSVLGKSAFRQCSNLTGTLVISSRVERMEGRVFEGCAKVTQLTIGIGNIPDYGFSGMSGVTNLTIQNGVKSIGKHAFEGDSSINGSVKLPDSLETIQERAFKGCTSISSLSLPKGIKMIETFAFENCTQTGLKYRGTKAEWDKASKEFSKSWWKGWASREPRINENGRPTLKTEK